MGETRAAIIKAKPRPQYTERARMNRVEGTVILNVTLAASGDVKNISVVKGLPQGLTRAAIEAARRIEFEPAVHREGGLLSQWVELEYVFSLDGADG